MGGGSLGAVPFSNSVLHFSYFSPLTRPISGKPFFPIKELADRPSISIIRAEGNEERHQKNSSARARKAEWLEDYPETVDGRPPLPPNKEKILALFKRVQASISKGESVNSKKWGSKIADDDKSTAEAIFEVLHQSRRQGKGRASGKKMSKSPAARKNSQTKEQASNTSPVVNTKLTSSGRPPSSFVRKSPISNLLNPRGKVELENETMSTMVSYSISNEETQQETADLGGSNNAYTQEFSKLKAMNLIQLKEVAKSKGLRGYSKLKKSELLDLLTGSVNSTLP